MDYFSHDIRTCSFLSRREGIGYAFAHNSFKEFFVAKKLLSDALSEKRAAWEQQPLPPEIIRFASELLAEPDDPRAKILVDWCADDPLSTAGRNCLSVIALAGREMSSAVETQYGLAASVLRAYAAFLIGDDQRGRDFSFEHLYRRCLAVVKKLAWRRQRRELEGFNEADIGDVAHDVFFRVSGSLRGRPLMTARELDAYIGRAVNWESLDLLRVRSKRFSREESLDALVEDLREDGIEFSDLLPSSPEAGPEAKVIAMEMVERLRRLDPAGFALLKDYYVEGLTSSELAKQLGVSGKTLMNRLHRVRQKFAEELQAHQANRQGSA